jgi:hypothetical protein
MVDRQKKTGNPDRSAAKLLRALLARRTLARCVIDAVWFGRAALGIGQRRGDRPIV